jgi:hypothetical protein
MIHDILVKYPKNPLLIDIKISASSEIVFIVLIIIAGIVIKHPVNCFIQFIINRKGDIN